MSRDAWIVGYDIASPKRLRRVHRFLRARSLPVQYSIFLAVLTRAELDEMLRGLGTLIHPRRDDVRAWPLPEHARILAIGPGLPEGITAALGGVATHLAETASSRKRRSA